MHPHFSLKNLSKECALYMAKYGIYQFNFSNLLHCRHHFLEEICGKQTLRWSLVIPASCYTRSCVITSSHIWNERINLLLMNRTWQNLWDGCCFWDLPIKMLWLCSGRSLWIFFLGLLIWKHLAPYCEAALSSGSTDNHMGEIGRKFLFLQMSLPMSQRQSSWFLTRRHCIDIDKYLSIKYFK